MTLYLYNTLTRAKEAFVPLTPGRVGMYVCGPTVYDLAHIGNARPVVVFDVLYRLLKRRFAHVTYVRNITDVDDKINAAARAEGVPIEVITARTIKAYHDDMAALAALPPDVEPRATETIAEMIAMIETLIAKGHAYAADGHVLFHVPSYAEYGRLSRRNRDELIAGARVEVAPYKKDAGDFVLWKPSDAETPGWDSPWGRGRPGWHIECSAMSKKNLGTTFDIHGGGRDLVFPHHENEVAQSICANGASFARYWVHNGFLTVDGEKMSKSVGNFRTVREELAKAPGEALRLAMLTAHYRQPIDWNDGLIQEAKGTLDRWYGALRELGDVEPVHHAEPVEVFAGLLDDLNTPLAIAGLHALANEAYKEKDPSARQRLKGAMLEAGDVLGLLQQAPEAWFKAGESNVVDIDAKIEARNAAKKAKNFAEADRIRDELKAAGIVLEDRPGGKTEWRRA